ncbi:hypothetical protein IPdc08_01213 [archaeon]|nr:hypothetical protein IPdc08_01213 [archaeon]
MTSLLEYTLREEYLRVELLGDKLSHIDTLIDWSAFRPIVVDMYTNKSQKGGRPNIDEVLMIKLLVLQEWHGLSDPELERQVTDRISFRNFLGFPETIPDYSTVWYFRARLEETGNDKKIWKELQRRLDEKGLKVKKGVIQDATSDCVKTLYFVNFLPPFLISWIYITYFSCKHEFLHNLTFITATQVMQK